MTGEKLTLVVGAIPDEDEVFVQALAEYLVAAWMERSSDRQEVAA